MKTFIEQKVAEFWKRHRLSNEKLPNTGYEEVHRMKSCRNLEISAFIERKVADFPR